MAKPNSRTTFIDYCLRQLGAPVIEINVDDDQVDDRVDEALQFYQQYHADAIEKVYLKHEITSSDITNGYIPLTDAVTDVVRILPIRDTNSSNNMFDIQYQIMLNDMYNLGFMGQILDPMFVEIGSQNSNFLFDLTESHTIDINGIKSIKYKCRL